MTPPFAFRRPSGRGMTLVEMLVAMASTLILLGLVAQLFSILGSGVNGSRNSVEIADRLRTVQYTLRHDLAGATALGRAPPLDPASGLGFFEILEGPEQEYTWTIDPSGNLRPKGADSDNRLVGDCDDILIFTTRAVAEPFTGKLDQAAAIQSPYAEVMYFCTYTDRTVSPQMASLHRRQRLVMAHPNAGGFELGKNTAPVALAAVSDISARRVGSVLVPNTLSDLTKRENRFMRVAAFPHDLDLSRQSEFALGGERFGEDIILTNVLAFDVKVFDPDAQIKRIGSIAMNPGEPGYANPNLNALPVPGFAGAFVNLNWNGGTVLPFGASFPPALGAFSGRGVAVRQSPPAPMALPTYDTWSTHYGVGTEAGPAAYQPPYPVPLRGIEITIRCYEPASQQIRQVNIRHAL